MVERLEIKRISSILSIFGLALLLLISPCKVRNSIQTELGVPQTKVLNKGQSSISQSDCQTFEVSDAAETTAKPNFKHLDFLISEVHYSEFTTSLLKHYIIPSPSRNQLVSDIPLYILYHNLKIYS